MITRFGTIFERKTQDHPTFLSKGEVLRYLKMIPLSIRERTFVDASFRTRIWKTGNTLDFQFRISPSSLTETEIHNLENTRISLQSKLSSLLPDHTLRLTMKVSDCCGKGCYGCEKYREK